MPRVMIDNRYKILKKCGAGATGNVYKVRDLKDNRIIALKILSNERAAQRFKREFRLLTGLRHPHLCTVYDFGILDDGKSYFTMEYVNGENIFHATQRLSHEKIYPWIVQLCRVLEYIHSKGLIHYDIKPGNVLIHRAEDNGGRAVVKLMDFGLAGEQQFEGGTLIKGTFPYIAPEVIKGVVIDHRADLYSLGVLLYELFTRRTFQERKESFTTILQQQIDRSSEPVTEVDANIPDNLERLIIRLLSFEPATRFSRANEVIRGINKLSGTKFKFETEKTLEGYLLSSRFVGRDKEMSLLKSLYEKARQGEGKVVLVTGDVGIGKSRLLKEFKIFTQLKRSHCFTGYAYQDKIAPLGPFFDIFNELINFIRDSELFRSRELKLSLAVLFKMFPDLMDAHSKKDLPKLVPLEPEHEKLRNFEALSGLIEYSASMLGELVILLEDLHWADDLSIQFLEYLGRDVAGMNIFICGACRKKELVKNRLFKRIVVNLRHEGYLNQIELSPLRFKSLYSFLDSTITPGSNSSELVRYLMKKTGGNPFFVEEIMRTLLRKRSVSIGEKMDIEDLKQISIPETIEDAVLKRIEDLDSASQRVVKFAAVLLKGFNYDLMKRLTGLSSTSLSRALWELKRRQVLVEDGNTYRFYHTTLGEVVNKRLGYQEKRELNYRVGKVLAGVNKRNIERVVEDVAYYFINAKDPKRGVVFGLRAAKKSSGRHANEQAIRFYKGVLGLLSDKHSKLRFDILQQLAEIEVLAGYYEDAIKNYNRALYIKITTRARQADIFRKIGDFYRKIPEYQKALVYYKRGINLLKKTEKNKHIAFIKSAINAGIGYAYLGMGDSENANIYNLRALNFLKNLRSKKAVMLRNDVFYNIGVIGINKGNYDKAFSNFKKAYESNKKIRNEIGVVLLLFAFGYGYYLKGNYDKAFDYYQKSMKISEKIGNPRGVSRALIQLACILYARGHYSGALEYFQRALSTSTKIGNKREVALSFQWLGNCFMMLCDYKNAEKYYKRALRLWDDLSIKDNEASTILDLGSLYQRLGNYASALRFFKKSLKIFRNLKRPYEISLSNVKISSVFFDIGEFLKARTYIEEALRIASAIELKDIKIECYLAMSQINIMRQNFVIAHDCYDKGIRLVKELGMKRKLLRFSLLLAESYYQRKKYSKGIKIANKTIKTAKKIGTKDLYAEALLVKSKCGIRQGNLSRLGVFEILDEAKMIAEGIGFPEILWKLYFRYGEFLHENKEYRKALIYYQKCIMVLRDVVAKFRNNSYKESYLNRSDRRAAITNIKTKSKINLKND